MSILDEMMADLAGEPEPIIRMTLDRSYEDDGWDQIYRNALRDGHSDDEARMIADETMDPNRGDDLEDK